ncbi:MAG: mdcB [Planctomycetota bacterium]|nr:mdcB [Planctomycetota bacterium]
MNPPSSGLLAQIACVMEVTARKPGNVHRFRDFDDATYLDFLLSAAAIAAPMDEARSLGVGRTVLASVEATRRVISTNTNLGMILLLAPLAVAYESGGDLASSVANVLDVLTVDDARFAYQAIRLARPGSLGRSDEEDVADEPTISLRDAMRLAADRDLVARQYANGYADVFGLALPALRSVLIDGRSLEDAIIHAYLTVLARHPDTLILRKRGPLLAAEASRLAADALTTGSVDTLDAFLRSDRHALNPGATADLICAALFAALADGTMALPRPSGPEGWSFISV